MIRLDHLESNVTVACQLRCVSCNHFTSIQAARFKASMMPPEILERDLAHFGRVAHVDRWAAIGGEPLLNPRLVEILQVARRSGVMDKIEVWTNGIALAGVSSDFWRSVDVLVVSAYPGVLSDDDIARIYAKCDREGVELVVKDERQVPNFERLLEPTPTDDATTQRKWAGCFFRNYSRVLDWGYFARCCTSPFIPMLIQGRPFGSDMLKVDESLTEHALTAFLNRDTFMESCRTCAGLDPANRRHQPWREVRDPAAWLRASAGLPA